MANLFVTIPSPANNGVGADASISSFGRVKTFTVAGVFTGSVTIEISVDGGLTYADLTTFSNPGTKTMSVVGSVVRVRRADVDRLLPGLPSVDVGSNDNGATYATLLAPTDNGDGIALDTSVMGQFKTFVIAGDFTGGATVEVSEDGLQFHDLFTVTRPGLVSKTVMCASIRVRRSSVNPHNKGQPLITIGAAKDVTSKGTVIASSTLLNDVKDFGAVGDGATNDTSAIQAAIDDAVVNGIGGIMIPGGTYMVFKTVNQSTFRLTGVTDFIVTGIGPQSILKSDAPGGVGDGGDWYMFRVWQSCTRITFRNFTADGNKDNLTNLDEQTHGINITGNSGISAQFSIHDVHFINWHGDGVRAIGELATGKVLNINIENCHFIDANRSGVGVQRAMEYIHIRGCYFEGISDQAVDFEPTSLGSVDQFIIKDNLIFHATAATALTLSGNGFGHEQSVISGNVLIDGNVFTANMRNLRIADNIIIGNPIPTTALTFQAIRFNDDIEVVGNLFLRPAATTGTTIVGVNFNNGVFPTRMMVSNNLFIREGSPGTMLVFDGATNAHVVGNRFVNQSATASDGQAIVWTTNGQSAHGILVARNVCDGDEGGGTLDSFCAIIPASGNSVGECSIVGNQVRGCERGAHFFGGAYTAVPLVSGNIFDVTVEDITLPVALSAVTIGGNGGTLSAKQMLGDGTPEGAVTAPVGSWFQRRDGGAGTTFFVKETGAGNTGWVGK